MERQPEYPPEYDWPICEECEKHESEVKRLREQKQWLLREIIEYKKQVASHCDYAIPGEYCLDLAIKNAEGGNDGV